MCLETGILYGFLRNNKVLTLRGPIPVDVSLSTAVALSSKDTMGHPRQQPDSKDDL